MDVVKQGYVRVKSKRLSLWKKRWIILRRASSKGPVRLEKYCDERSSRNISHHPKTLLLTNVTNVCRLSSTVRVHSFAVTFDHDPDSRWFSCDSGNDHFNTSVISDHLSRIYPLPVILPHQKSNLTLIPIFCFWCQNAPCSLLFSPIRLLPQSVLVPSASPSHSCLTHSSSLSLSLLSRLSHDRLGSGLLGQATDPRMSPSPARHRDRGTRRPESRDPEGAAGTVPCLPHAKSKAGCLW